MHLIFDLDGTLVDTLPGIRLAIECAVRQVLPTQASERLEFEIGPPVREVMRESLGNVSDHDLDRLEATFRLVYDRQAYLQSVPYPGVLNTLPALRQAGHILYLVTNKPCRPTRCILEYLGLAESFRLPLSLDSRQPPFANKAACLKYLLQVQDIEPSRALYIGDAPSDAVAARAAGIAFLGVEYGYGNFDPFAPSIHLLHSFPEILDAISVK